MIGRQRAYSLLSPAVVGLVLIGCSSDVGDDKPREPVSGTVLMDGQPLPKGVILFAPASGAGEASASATGTIENGEFSIPRTQGPVPGKYKVLISHTDQTEGHVKIELKKLGKKAAGPKETIPAKYNSQTTLLHEVKKGGDSGLKFELQSK
jgi:hypothetical protein